MRTIKCCIHSNADGPACGIDFGYYPGAGVVAFERDGRLWAGACTNPVGIDELEEVFGAGYPPNRSIREDPSLPTALVVGLVLVVAITFPTVWLVVQRRRARRSPAAVESPDERS